MTRAGAALAVVCALLPAVTAWGVVATYLGLPELGESNSVRLWSGLAKGIAWALLLASVLAVVAMARRGRLDAGTRLFSGVAAAVGISGAVAVGCLGGLLGVVEIGPRTLLPEYVAQDGARYRVTYSSFLQGRTLTLTRVANDGALCTKLHALGATSFDSPRLYADVLVPRGYDADGATGVFPAPGGRLVVSVHGTASVRESYLAYTPATGTVVRWEDAVAMSPFVLFGPDDEGDDAVFDLWLTGLRSRCAGAPPDGPHFQRSGIPVDATLAADLEHPSAWVRDAIRRIAEAGGETWYPETLARLR